MTYIVTHNGLPVWDYTSSYPRLVIETVPDHLSIAVSGATPLSLNGDYVWNWKTRQYESGANAVRWFDDTWYVAGAGDEYIYAGAHGSFLDASGTYDEMVPHPFSHTCVVANN